jgi:hypothetical protein
MKGTQRWPGGQDPPQVGYCDGPQVEEKSVVVVVDVVTHPLGPHASQQLAGPPTHPVSVQRSALGRIVQRAS